jgi:flagellar basal body rod protein FlgB
VDGKGSGTVSEQGLSTPRPDPTILTTEQLHREIAALREFVLGEVRHVSQINDERFRAVEAQFEQHLERTREQKTDTQQAVQSALTSAKELVAQRNDASERAIAKSEQATVKQVDGLAVLLEKSSEAKDEKIDDLKARLDRLEGRAQGTQMSFGMVFAIVGALAAAIGTVVILANVLTGSG